MESTEVTTIQRARCVATVPGMKSHLIDIARLIDVREGPYGRGIRATGPCPICGACWTSQFGSFGPADKVGTYDLIGVKGVKVEKKCSAACRMSASAECKCSCGGMAHGMRA